MNEIYDNDGEIVPEDIDSVDELLRLQTIEKLLKQLIHKHPEFGETMEWPVMCRCCYQHEDGIEEYEKYGQIYSRAHIPHDEDCIWNQIMKMMEE